MPMPVSLEHVFDVSARVAKPLEFGDTGLGERRVIDITGGAVSGPRLAGRVLPGADFQIIRASGLTELHARYAIQAEDGALIYVVNDGIRFGPKAALDALKRGEPVDPDLIYFRSVPRFETSAPKYSWMMESIFIASGARRPDAVELCVYRVG